VFLTFSLLLQHVVLSILEHRAIDFVYVRVYTVKLKSKLFIILTSYYLWLFGSLQSGMGQSLVRTLFFKVICIFCPLGFK